MKNIHFFNSPKYRKEGFEKIENCIFRYNDTFLTSISFQKEPALGEGRSAREISQYPLEDVLDATRTYIHDFYTVLNTEDSDECFLELASPRIENIRTVLSLFGKHIYNRKIKGIMELIIE